MRTARPWPCLRAPAAPSSTSAPAPLPRARWPWSCPQWGGTQSRRLTPHPPPRAWPRLPHPSLLTSPRMLPTLLWSWSMTRRPALIKMETPSIIWMTCPAQTRANCVSALTAWWCAPRRSAVCPSLSMTHANRCLWSLASAAPGTSVSCPTPTPPPRPPTTWRTSSLMTSAETTRPPATLQRPRRVATLQRSTWISLQLLEISILRLMSQRPQLKLRVLQNQDQNQKTF